VFAAQKRVIASSDTVGQKRLINNGGRILANQPNQSDKRQVDYIGEGDLFGELYLAERAVQPLRISPRSLLPGVLIAAAGAGAAAWLSEHYGFPIILLGLLIGLSLNFVSRDPVTHPGLDLASNICLKLGIVALGFQVTLAQIGALGVWPFAALLTIIAMTFAAGLAGAQLSGQSRFAGILAGGATAICGASAALALYGVIGKERLPQAQFALTLVGVSLASALAMSIYPLIASELGLSDQQAGFIIGASVHDVAQAIGGGFAFSDSAGTQATIVKLSRVALLAPLVVVVSLWVGSAGNSAGVERPLWRRLLLPWFIAAFVGLLLLNSIIAVPESFRESMLALSKALLLLAVTATAMRSRLDRIMELGWRAAVPVVAATLLSFAASLAYAAVLID
jgi:uncharacterized integral membrane protein (TIGR00698 family)